MLAVSAMWMIVWSTETCMLHCGACKSSMYTWVASYQYCKLSCTVHSAGRPQQQLALLVSSCEAFGCGLISTTSRVSGYVFWQIHCNLFNKNAQSLQSWKIGRRIDCRLRLARFADTSGDQLVIRACGFETRSEGGHILEIPPKYCPVSV